MPISPNEQFLRDHLEATRAEILKFEQQAANLHGKYEAYDAELSPEQKVEDKHKQRLAAWQTKLDELNCAISAKKNDIPFLESAIRDAVVLSVAASGTAPAPTTNVVMPAPVVPELPELVRTFFYGKSTDNVEEWIQSFKSYVQFYSARLSDFNSIKNELAVHMRGAAFAWFDGRDFVDLDAFFKALRYEFGERLVQDKLVKQLHDMVPANTLAEYVRAFRGVYKRLDASHRDIIWIRFAFLANVPPDMLSAVSSSIMNAQSVDNMFDSCADTGYIKNPTAQPVVGDIDMNALTDNTKKVKIEDFVKQCTCFKCTGFGHMASDCPSKKKNAGGGASASSLRN